MLLHIQIMVSNILRENTKLANEVTELQSAIQQQKGELINIKTALARTRKQQDALEIQLATERKILKNKSRKSWSFMTSRTHFNRRS